MALTKENFKIEKTGSVATVTLTDDNAFYTDTELSKTQIKEVFDHAQGYIKEVAEVSSKVSTDIMSEDKSIDEVVITAPYGVSKRGTVNVKARRSVTFPGVNGSDPVTRADLRVVVKDPLTKVSKTKLKDIQKAMTEELLS